MTLAARAREADLYCEKSCVGKSALARGDTFQCCIDHFLVLVTREPLDRGQRGVFCVAQTRGLERRRYS